MTTELTILGKGHVSGFRKVRGHQRGSARPNHSKDRKISRKAGEGRHGTRLWSPVCQPRLSGADLTGRGLARRPGREGTTLPHTPQREPALLLQNTQGCAARETLDAKEAGRGRSTLPETATSGRTHLRRKRSKRSNPKN